VEAFQLDPAFEATSAHLADLELCQARLQLDARYPWIVLIPRRAGLTEIEQLSPDERALLMEEIVRAGQAVRAMSSFSPSSSWPPTSSPSSIFSSTSILPTPSSSTTTSPPTSWPWKTISKLNVASLGNVTSQLHVHVVGRRSDDSSWPSPVWSYGSALPLSADVVAAVQQMAPPLLRSPNPRRGA